MRDACANKVIYILELQVMLNRIVLIGAIAGIALAHGVVLYKIDSGVRSSDVKPVIASRSHRAAYW
jgi:hypothetical protein